MTAKPHQINASGHLSYPDHHSPTAVQDSIAAEAMMRKELDKLTEASSSSEDMTLKPPPDGFKTEMGNFLKLFQRYLSEKTKGKKVDWEKIKGPDQDMVKPYQDLPPGSPEDVPKLLGKLAVLKLNGGLGTTMGCVGPKSVIEVRDGMTFLDLTVRQIEYLNTVNEVDVPLILMNSFNTDKDTQRIIHKYQGHRVQIRTFNQSKFPRITKDNYLLMPRTHDDPKTTNWYPPGHGDLYQSLYDCGLLDELLEQGKEWLFISNVDNLGATVDTTILKHVNDSGCDFLMEVTDKTKADVKGGTLIDYGGKVRLLEIAQVPPEHVDDFKSVRKFKIFNTNNLWVSLKAIKRLLSQDELKLDLIVNVKTHDSGKKVIQLETAVGAAIRYFQSAQGVNVPRSRFLPVKSTSDLFLVTSDLYYVTHGELRVNPKRNFQITPNIKLGDHFKKVNSFLERFKTPPAILDLDHLSVTGNVWFGSDVTLKGTVIVVANDESRIDIPSGSVLEDKVVTGHLRVLDH